MGIRTEQQRSRGGKHRPAADRELVRSSTNLAPSTHASTRTTASHAYDATASAVERIRAAAARRMEPTAAARNEAAT